MVVEINGNEWIPGQWNNYCKATNTTTTFYEQDWQTRYVITFYNSILLLLGNDIHPNNIPLFCLGIILLLQGAFVEAHLFGSMTNIFGTINSKSTRL